ncbi:hypothetical protein EB008_00165 [bacterium]|jgi:hypothetical protein|nr:hypothetical protein [bacterium]
MDKSSKLEMKKHSLPDKNPPEEHQLSFLEGFEDEILANMYPWGTSCKKIKRLMKDFLKRVE